METNELLITINTLMPFIGFFGYAYIENTYEKHRQSFIKYTISILVFIIAICIGVYVDPKGGVFFGGLFFLGCSISHITGIGERRKI